MNKSYIGTCGVLKNNSPSPDKIIHSDDIFKYENFNKNFGYPMSILWGTILECTTEEIDYVGIKMLGSKNQEVIRIKKEFYEIIKCPRFNIGDKVKLIKYPDKKATVKKICWHDKDKRIYYFLNVENDKRKSISRYYEDENKFEKI